MSSLKGANTGELNKIFRIVLVARDPQRECPQTWEHAREQRG